MIIDIGGKQFAQIAVFRAREGWPPAQLPVDYCVVGLEHLRGATTSPLSQVVAIEVQDDAMKPTAGPGDRVLVDCSQTRIAGPGLYAIAAEGGVSVRRVTRHFETGAITLACDNPLYAPQTVSADSALDVVGRVFLSCVRY